MKNLLCFIIIAIILLISSSIVISSNVEKIEGNSDYTNLIENESTKGDGITDYWALLVGVGVYADDPYQNIPTMLEAVDIIYEVLLESPFWSADNIKVLKGEDATSMNIIKGLRWIDRMDDSDDIALVYFNSHGGHLKIDIPPRDEKDRTDEMFATYWGFVYQNNPIGFIWDDELNFLLNRLNSKGVCLIVDCCFSGGFNDPPNWIINKGIMFPKSHVKNYNIAQNWMEDFSKELKSNGRVVITACREEELAWAGMFSPFLIDGLRGYADNNSDGIVSAEELFLYTKTRCHNQLPTIYDGYDGELPIIQVNYIKPLDRWYKTKINKVNEKDEEFICSVDNSEDAIVCGFVRDDVTNDPIDRVSIHLRWYDGFGGDDYNWTITESDGFYNLGIPEGYFFLDFRNDDYFYYETEMYEINKSEILWLNVTLKKIPPENAVVCGYLKNSETNEPMYDALVKIEWHNDEGDMYWRYKHTDSSGFYQINIVAGEIYFQIWEWNFLDINTFRYDIDDDKPYWFNFSLEPEKVSVYISKPLNALYRNNRMLIPFSSPIITKDIEINAFPHDYWYNSWDYIDKVEFYIDGVLKYTDTSEPYKWMWNENTPFRSKHTIKVIAYDGENMAYDEKEILKLF
ncbi:MAG: caspase family protein [Thermoplasmatales archaeon]|nr:MAG: caspase family protein [Thermoplasmatales archaeon]